MFPRLNFKAENWNLILGVYTPVAVFYHYLMLSGVKVAGVDGVVL